MTIELPAQSLTALAETLRAQAAALVATANLLDATDQPATYAMRRLDATMHQLRDREAKAQLHNTQAAWRFAQDQISAYTEGNNYRVTFRASDDNTTRPEVVVRAQGPEQAARRALNGHPLFLVNHTGPTPGPDAQVFSVARLTPAVHRPAATARFNVLTPIVALIHADNADEAKRKHDQQLTAMGLETYPTRADAFEIDDSAL